MDRYRAGRFKGNWGMNTCMKRYLEDGSHEDRQSSQNEDNDTGHSLLPAVRRDSSSHIKSYKHTLHRHHINHSQFSNYSVQTIDHCSDVTIK